MAFRVTCKLCDAVIFPSIATLDESSTTTLFQHATTCKKRSTSEDPPQRNALGSVLALFHFVTAG